MDQRGMATRRRSLVIKCGQLGLQDSHKISGGLQRWTHWGRGMRQPREDALAFTCK